jgi:recombination protein RecA
MAKTKTDSAPARLQLIEELAAEINKEMGGEVLIKGSHARQDLPRCTTGILSYDLALGGGWAANQWNEVVGEYSSGKTALAYITIAENQRLDPEFICLYLAAEEYVPEYAASFGVDQERMWVIETNEMEKALDLVVKAVANRAVDMVVVDSLPALVTIAENNADADEMKVAPGARILSTFFKKCAKAARRTPDPADRSCTLIMLNQWRDAIGVMFGDPRTTPGGKAKDYWFFTRMEIRRKEWVQELKSDIDTRVGQTTIMRTIKNKTYRPQQSAEMTFYFADSTALGVRKGQVDRGKDVVNVALALDLFEGRYKFEGERIAGNKEDLYDVVANNAVLQDKLRAAAHKAALAKPSTVAVTEDGPEPTDDEVAADFELELTT